MTAFSIFHWFFVLAFAGMLVIRIAYGRKARRAQAVVETKEGFLNLLVRAVFGIGYILSLILYCFAPDWFGWATFDLPVWLRWLGVGFALLSDLLLWWIQWALDVQFNTTLHTQASHQLIQHGPYRWVRHPMYTNFFLMGLSWLLLTANAWVGLPLIGAMFLLVWSRVPKEEQVLTELFGDAYRQYIRQTGRFLPRFIK